MSSTDLLDDLIRSVLNDPFPDEAAPPWQDVLRRVPGPKPRRRRVRRLVLAFAILAVVLVPPAVAFHRDLADWILGKPAPEPVAVTFRQWNVLRAKAYGSGFASGLFASRLSALDVSKAQGVVALETPQGTVSLWDAPQRRGGRCWVFLFGAPGDARRSVGSCDLGGAPDEALSNVGWVAVNELPKLIIVHARVQDGVDSVELRVAGESVQPVQIVGGHAVAAVPRDLGRLVLVAKDADGSVVQVEKLMLPPPGLRCSGFCAGGAGEGEGRTIDTFIHFGQATPDKR